MTTEISFLNKKEDNNDEILIYTTLSDKTNEELFNTFFDGDEHLHVRIEAIEEVYNRDRELCFEYINKISSMFMFTPTEIFRKLLKYIVTNSCLDIHIKSECARAIYDDNKINGYECFHYISLNFNKDFPIPLRIEIIKILLETNEYYKDTLNSLVKIITDINFDCEYRYKLLFNLGKDTKKYISNYIEDAYFSFVCCKYVYTRYRILGSQFILQRQNIEMKNKVEEICKGFMEDEFLDYDLRADSADLLIRLGSKESKELGQEIIIILGRNNQGFTTVYTNKQNVHDEKIDENVRKFILELASITTKTNDGKLITFIDVQKEIDELNIYTSLTQKEQDRIKSSLLRISIDQTIYDGGQTIQSIFNKIWQLIDAHEYKESLQKRMMDELIDMANTCASGHVSRLVNCLSTFEINGMIVNFDIGWKKQVQSNLVGRLNKRIRDLTDLDLQEKILEEMTISGCLSNKPSLSTFFRNNLLNIREELYNEFVNDNYISEQEFEEYFRYAITFFEEGN